MNMSLQGVSLELGSSPQCAPSPLSHLAAADTKTQLSLTVNYSSQTRLQKTEI